MNDHDRPIYLDHNATTPLDPRVRDAMLPWLGERHGNPSSVHSFGRAARDAVEVVEFTRRRTRNVHESL